MKRIAKQFIDRLERRVGSQEATMRFMLRVQRESLADAEKLRKMAIAVEALAPSRVRALATFARGLPRFYKPLPARDEAKVQKFLKSGKTAKVARR